jgi:UDP-N-acetylmuramoyl-tripeptide--D-alanyl-D-alanine ligase
MFDGVKILITPGMVELGDSQDECNRQFGIEAAAVCDYVILVGERQTKSIMEGLKSASYPDEKTFVAETLEHAFKAMEKLEAEKINSGGRQKIVLLENDLPDNY